MLRFFKNSTRLLLGVFITIMYSQSQEPKGSVDGKIILNGEPAPYYSVLAYLADSTFVKGGITDSVGYFKLKNLELNKYFITVRAVNLKEKIISHLELNKSQPSVNLGIVETNSSQIQFLEEVVVTSELPTIKRSNDKIVVTIANSILAEGNSIADLLNYIPTVRVDPNGELTVNQQGGVVIYIDGKSFQRVQKPSEVLENIDPNSIERIEVFSNPPARFDAEGSAIINIITLKKKKQSSINNTIGHSFFQYNGQIGDPYSERISANLNYNFGKVQAFGQLSFGESLGEQFSTREREYLDSGVLIVDDANFESLARSIRYGLGIQFNTGKGNLLSLDINGLTSIGDNIPTTTTSDQEYFLNAEKIPDSSNMLLNNLLRQYGNNSIGLSYWFNQAKKKINRDFQFIYSTRSNNNSRDIESSNLQPNFSNIRRKNDYESLTLVINNGQPLSKKMDVLYGGKYTFLKFGEKINQNLNVFTFDYSESISALYTELKGKIKLFDWQLGIRIENTYWESRALELNHELNDSYLSAFPTLSFSIPIDSLGKRLGISYSRRITRPHVTELNPAPRITDQFSSQTGNAFLLRPRFYDNFELNCSLGDFYLTAWYRRTGNQRAYVPMSIDGLDVLYEVLSTKRAFSVGTSLSYRRKIGFWNPNIDFSIFHNSESLVDNSSIGNTGFNFFVNNNFQFKKGWSGLITTFFNSKLTTGYNSVSSVSNTSAALRWIPESNKNFTFGLRMNDVFNSNTFSFRSKYPELINLSAVLSGSREVIFSITYKFEMGVHFDEKKSEKDIEQFRIN